MDVLYLINYAGNGGSEKYVKTLATNLLERGGHPYLGYNQSGQLSTDLENLNIPTLQLTMRHPFDIKAARQLANYCYLHEITTIHTQFARENYIAIIAKTLGGAQNIIYTAHINLPNNIPWKLTNLLFTRRNNAIIAVCESVKTLLIKNKYPKNKIQVIFNGVEHTETTPQTTINNKKTFVTLARLSEEKGLMFLLKAINIFIKQSEDNAPNFHMNIAGDGPQKQQLQAYINENNLQDHITLLGHVTDTRALLANSYAFINSSSSEALSFAVLEAMAQGLPIIVTNVGGNVDIINHGKCGISVGYNNVDDMINAIKTLISDENLYQEYKKNTPIAIRDVFNIDITLQKTFALYR